MALPTKNRLKKRTDFDKVFKTGKAVKGSFLFIKLKNSSGVTRFGLIIPKTVEARATARNRLKRVFSEKIRAYLKENGLAGKDIVVTVKKVDKEEVLLSELGRLLGMLK